jgi:hypothetical protein
MGMERELVAQWGNLTGGQPPGADSGGSDQKAPAGLIPDGNEDDPEGPLRNEGRSADRKGRAEVKLPGLKELRRARAGWSQTRRPVRRHEVPRHLAEVRFETGRGQREPREIEPPGRRSEDAFAVRGCVVLGPMLVMAGICVASIIWMVAMMMILVDLVDQSEMLQMHVR